LSEGCKDVLGRLNINLVFSFEKLPGLIGGGKPVLIVQHLVWWLIERVVKGWR
jgi:hypothetical protein